jgi:6-phosphofructo-2-kinase/fructose-2,6-biphosphatase
MRVEPGIYTYKFLVDKTHWQHARDQAVLTDQDHNINNVVSISPPQPVLTNQLSARQRSSTMPVSMEPGAQSFRAMSKRAKVNMLMIDGVSLADDNEPYTTSDNINVSGGGGGGGGGAGAGVDAHTSPRGTLDASPRGVIVGPSATSVVHDADAVKVGHDVAVDDSGRPSSPKLQASADEPMASLTSQGGASTASLDMQPFFGRHAPTSTARKMIIVLVGLPARGKSFVGKKLNRYLRWAGCESAIFNIGSYRRKLLGSYHSHDFFRPDNPAGNAARDQLFHAAMDDVLEYLATKGTVALLDGTNSTRKRRRQIAQRVEAAAPGVDAKVIFLELLCNDAAIIDANILLKTKGPDYKDVPLQEALADFRARLAHYEAAYETVDEPDQSYIKVFDVGQQVVTNNVRGFLPTKLVFYLMNMHILPRDIMLVRAGETAHSAEGRIGGDSLLSARGIEFRANLHKFVHKYFAEEPDALAFLTASSATTAEVDAAAAAVAAARELLSDDKEEAPVTGDDDAPTRAAKERLCVWTSTLRRSIQTAYGLPCAQRVRWRALRDIDAGVCDGLTNQQFMETYPDDFKAREENKLTYRFNRGENYADVIARLEPVLIEMERTVLPLLIVAHLPVLRCIYAYLNDLPINKLPHIDLPMHTVVMLRSDGSGRTHERRFELGPTTTGTGTMLEH